MKNKKPKVLMYYAFGNKVGGPLTYINTIIQSELKDRYEFVTCFQDMAPGGINLDLFRRMKQKIRDEQPDIVHVHGLQSEGLYGTLAAKAAGCRCIVMTVHGFAFDVHHISSLKRFVYRRLVEPLTLHLSDKVYCVCRYASQRPIIQKHAKKNNCGFIHNAAPELTTTISRQALRQQLGCRDEDVVFVIAGRITQDKGFDILADAVKALDPEQKKRFKLLVLGDGSYEETFSQTVREEIANGQVMLVGQTDRVADYLFASDVSVLPSYHENLPIALLEAGKAGLPCITSDVGGIPEVIKDGETGFIVRTKDPMEYARKMELLIKDRDLRESMKRAIQADIETRFSLKEMCKKIEELYG